jgi:hypothetical protein
MWFFFFPFSLFFGSSGSGGSIRGEILPHLRCKLVRIGWKDSGKTMTYKGKKCKIFKPINNLIHEQSGRVIKTIHYTRNKK